MEDDCIKWGIPYLNLSSTEYSKIKEEITKIKPKVILTSIEAICDEEVQAQLLNVNISFVSVDEAQVDLVSHLNK